MTVELFAACQYPLAARLNEISNELIALNAIYAGAEIELMAQEADGPGSAWMFRHQHRYLLYDSTGQLEDPTGVNDPVTLSDPDSGLGILDLETVEWLAPGRLYRITGCQAAWERREPV